MLGGFTKSYANGTSLYGYSSLYVGVMKDEEAPSLEDCESFC